MKRETAPTRGTTLLEVLVLEFVDIHAQILQQRVDCGAEVGDGGLETLRAAIADQGLSVDGEFVPLGVTSEIVERVDDQDLLIIPELLPVKVHC